MALAAPNVCCAIEMEPRTLSQGQLTHAREIAEDIVQKTDLHEASAVFIQEFKPPAEMAAAVVSDGGAPADHPPPDEVLAINNHGRCQCSVEDAASPQESPCPPPASAAAGGGGGGGSVKQPLSAPF
ncbi:uncharacterized protein LOC127243508 [Andrographis paniculata]|uniref:uncharacterized protein LOC127243508 n=1 Tax=Andrographis paniculata TaxID=175694 RepID=UPI0021E70D14|nr:uncharacterized protein LOC127243508 [Andrographis paniculata]